MYSMYQKYIPPIGRRYRYINTSKHACDASHASKQNKFIGKSCCQITVSASGRGFVQYSQFSFQENQHPTSTKHHQQQPPPVGERPSGLSQSQQQQPPPPHTTKTCYICLCKCFHSFGLRVRSLFWLGLAPFQPLEVH